MKFLLNNYTSPSLVKVKGPACNASYVYINNDKLLLARNTNYSFLKNGNGVTGWPFWHNYITTETLYKNVDNNWCSLKIISEPSLTEKQTYKYCGEEDFRISTWENEIYASYSICKCLFPDIVSNKHKIPIAISKLTSDYNLTDTKVILTNSPVEKNWQPIISDEYKFKYVYSYKPFNIIDISTFKIITLHNQFNENFRGSSQLIPWHDGFLSLVHKRNEPNTTYDHYLIEFDKSLNVIRISDPFKFMGSNIEFSTYIGVFNNQLEILMSVNDQIVYEYKLTEKLVDDILNKKLDNIQYDNNALYIKLFNDAFENQNYLAMLCCSTFINKQEYYVKALKYSKYIDLITNDRFFIQNKLINEL